MKRYVYIKPIGNISDRLLKRVEKELYRDFGVSVKVEKSEAGNPFYAFDHLRKQYYSTKILKEIITNPPEDILKIVGIVDVDIFIPILTFVFGEAQLDGIGALVSLARLRQEYYDMAPDEELLSERLIKEVFHELGHTFGLTHCLKSDCVMYLSNSIRDVDDKNDKFCLDCNEILLSKLSQYKDNI